MTETKADLIRRAISDGIKIKCDSRVFYWDKEGCIFCDVIFPGSKLPSVAPSFFLDCQIEEYIEPPKKVKKTFYRAKVCFKHDDYGRIIAERDWFESKEIAENNIGVNWKIIGWEEKEFEVEE